MRWVFLLLLAVNIGFGVFVYLRGKAPNPDAQLIAMQMNADKVRIVPPRPAPAPKPVTASARVACIEWGGFGTGELARAQGAVDRLALAARARRVEVSVTAGYWVFIPPQRSQAAMERKITELRGLGVNEYFPVLDPGRWRYAISLGIFRSEDGATRYLAQLRQKGVRSATVGEREQRVTQTGFLISDPTEQESVKLAELKNEFPGTEVRAVECPPS
ncbi:MAG TPA: SPOR domain-containing protein [Burkholderiales bacterium]|nr:SPOR domain-containing protein [Burkholderiales bacterium]